MKEIRILPLLTEHIPELLSIEHASFSTPWSVASFFNEIKNPNSISYAAVTDLTLIGYIIAKQIGDEGHILNLAVHPEMRRQGIAKALVRRILGELKAGACRCIYLEVRASNYPARRLYEGFGFKVAGIRKSYYLMPVEDAMVMMLGLYEG